MHRDFCKPRLVALIESWFGTDSASIPNDFAAQLGTWLGPIDAIRLQALQQPGTEQGLRAGTAIRGGHPSLADELARTRSTLTQLIARGLPRPSGKPSARSQPAETSPAPANDFASYRQHYREVQRRMDLLIEPLRSHCRDVLKDAHASLRQLALLDEAMEHALRARDKSLLARLPQLLERRFKSTQTGQAPHQPRLFESDLQALLLAELDLRLNPVEGLVEALHDLTGISHE